MELLIMLTDSREDQLARMMGQHPWPTAVYKAVNLRANANVITIKKLVSEHKATTNDAATFQ
jgi:hypothetical protein